LNIFNQGISPTRPLPGAGVWILASVAAVAGALPAWRASRIDPTQVLKET
jgi:ABC-type antimicrobial peptide transport system permease subunit